MIGRCGLIAVHLRNKIPRKIFSVHSQNLDPAKLGGSLIMHGLAVCLMVS